MISPSPLQKCCPDVKINRTKRFFVSLFQIGHLVFDEMQHFRLSMNEVNQVGA